MRHVPGFDPGWRRYKDKKRKKKRHWILVDCLDPFFAWIPDQSLSLTFVIKDRGQASGTSVEDNRTEKADSSRRSECRIRGIVSHLHTNDRRGVSLFKW